MTSQNIRRPLVALVVLGAALLASAPPVGETSDLDATEEVVKRPNVLFVLSDDQPDSTFRRRMMPLTFSALGDAVNFVRAIAAPPLCCPYRAGFLSGQYSQNHGVEKNRPGYSALRKKRLVLPEFLREAGYSTGFIGKYLNGTTGALGEAPAPGWDKWVAFMDKPSYRNPRLTVNGRVRQYSNGQNSSKTLTRYAKRFLDSHVGSETPFFLWLSHYPPHPLYTRKRHCSARHTAPSLPADLRFAQRFRFPRGPNWNRRPRGKAPWIRRIARQNAKRYGRTLGRVAREQWHCSLGAAQQVDRSVAAVVERLEENGQLEDTLLVFGSDNGVHFGEHQLLGKKGAYEEKLQAPLIIQAPQWSAFRSTAGSRRTELVSQVDLSATILDLAGAEPCVDGRCRRLDGRSLVELLRDRSSPGWAADRAIPVKMGRCRLRGFRTPKVAFLESEYVRRRESGGCEWPRAGFAELYRIDKDPDQLVNRARSMSETRLRPYRRRLRTLQSCSGLAGREEPRSHTSFCE